MRTLAFDGRMGASGDMLLGALLAAGADRSALAPVEDALDVAYDVGAVTDAGIAATTVEVRLADGQRAEGHGPHRTLADVREILDGMDLPADVAADAADIFESLAAAEGAVHGSDPDDVQFHEVGADDAIADVVGVCLLLADLGPERVVTTPLSAGGGEVEVAHGTYPVPVPAVVELADGADWELRGGPMDAELLTPTGAAILARVAEGVDTLPALSVTGSGYGAGSYRFADRPNVLRALVGETAALGRERITVLETNLDDATPEVLGGLQERLDGALDVTVVPTTMKKSRPGHLVRVVVSPEDAEGVARQLAEETGTLGVREHGAGHRWVADREQRTVAVPTDGGNYEVAVKVASAGDGVYDVSAEFDDALDVARASGLPVREVMRRAELAARE